MRALCLLVLAAGVGLGAGCRRAPQVTPLDPVLDALREEERVAGLNYAEGQGKHLFEQYCVTCHGDGGKGDGQNASNLNPPVPDLTTSKNLADLGYLRRVITRGSAAVGRSPLSPPWGRNLRPQEIEYLIAYCRSLTRTPPPSK